MIKKPKSTKNNNYLDNEKFYNALVQRKADVLKAQLENKEKPRASDLIGKCILLICENLGRRYNFSGYSYVQEMIYKAVEDCIVAIDQFDVDKYNKPYAYFTMIAWRAFVRVINDEKKQQAIKHKHILTNSFQNILLDNTIDNHQINIMSEDLEVSASFIEKFEIDNAIKKKEAKNKVKKNKGLTKFIEEDENVVE